MRAHVERGRAQPTDSSGLPAGLGEVVVEIRARKRAGPMCWERETGLRRLAENVDDIIYRYELTPVRGFSYVSPAVTRVLGYTPEECGADPDLALEIVHPEDRNLLQAVLAGEDLSRPVTIRCLHKNGQTVWIEARNAAVYDAAGSLTAIEGIARDATERKRNEIQLLQQLRTRSGQEARRRVAAAEERLHRDIAELLHGRVQAMLLVAWLRLGQCQSLLATDPAAVRTIIDEVRNDLERIREHEVRQASHLLHPAIIRIGLVPAVRSLGRRFEEYFSISLVVDPRLEQLDDPVDNHLPELLRLVAYRVIEEALNNVFRHANASHVEIGLEVDPGERVALVVQDDGRGFDSTQAQSGLGLSSIAGRVEQVGGTWQVASAIGRGTRVWALLPLIGGDEDEIVGGSAGSSR